MVRGHFITLTLTPAAVLMFLFLRTPESGKIHPAHAGHAMRGQWKNMHGKNQRMSASKRLVCHMLTNVNPLRIQGYQGHKNSWSYREPYEHVEGI